MSSHATALYTAAQVRAIDHYAITRAGIPGATLMQRAAAAALAVLRARWPQARRIVVCCGPGNNGGDGWLLAAQARAAGLDAEVVAVNAERRGDAAKARAAFVDGGGKASDAASIDALRAADVYVDALFGSGLNRAVGGRAAWLIEQLDGAATPVLALDVPSGLNADTGVPTGPVVQAEATSCFVAWKRGLFTGRGPACCGESSLHTLAVPDAAYESAAADAHLLALSALPPRAADGHKGNYGHVLAIGGDEGMGGAVRLCAQAALRVGAGLVSVATRAANIAAINAARPELMAHAVDDDLALSPLLERASVLALGPGLGQGEWSRSLWQSALDSGKPVVIDADGLNLLALSGREHARSYRGGREHARSCAGAVLTPHPGEAARLLDCDVGAIQADRFAAARELAARYAAVVVLKGSGTLVAAPDGRVAVCPWGNPGMASGGMGDLLTGIIAGLLAQQLEAWDAACLGVGLHARAGDVAARGGQRGLLASDLLVPLRLLVNGIGDGG